VTFVYYDHARSKKIEELTKQNENLRKEVAFLKKPVDEIKATVEENWKNELRKREEHYQNERAEVAKRHAEEIEEFQQAMRKNKHLVAELRNHVQELTKQKKNQKNLNRQLKLRINELETMNQRVRRDSDKQSRRDHRQIEQLERSLEKAGKELDQYKALYTKEQQQHEKTHQHLAQKEQTLRFTLTALDELEDGVKIERLKERKFSFLIGSQEIAEEYGFERKYGIIDIPDDVDIFDPEERRYDEEEESYVEVFNKGSFKVIPGVASKIREILREEQRHQVKILTDEELVNLKDAGTSYRQISEMTGIKEGTVKARISRLRRQRREKQRGGES